MKTKCCPDNAAYFSILDSQISRGPIKKNKKKKKAVEKYFPLEV